METGKRQSRHLSGGVSSAGTDLSVSSIFDWDEKKGIKIFGLFYIIVSNMCAIFNISLITKHFPNKWKLANVTPVHKKRYLEVISCFTRFKEFNGEKNTATKTSNMFKIVPRIGTCDAEPINSTTVDSRYLEFDGTMEKIRVNRSSTKEELRRYRKCGLFNERETTRAKFWRAKTSIFSI
jgi:hypothetical protein